MKETFIKDSISGEAAAKGFRVSDALAKSDFGLKHAERMGFTFCEDALKSIYATDSNFKAAADKWASDQGLAMGEANIDALGQFFMLYLENTINTLYRGRSAVKEFGVKTVGDWTLERIVVKKRELLAKPSLYDDFGRAKFSGYNYTYDYRDTLRMEWAHEVTKLEEAVGAVMRRNPAKDKMDATTLSNAVWTNEFFLNGASIDGKKLYGVFNEPGLAGRKRNLPIDMESASLTVDDVIACLTLIKQSFVTDLRGNIDIETHPVSICMPLKWQTAFTIPNTVTGYTANKWLQENWKSASLRFLPEWDTADDGEPMALVYAKDIDDVGMDTINLFETSKLHLVGAMPSVKGREEAYSSSVAGTIIAAPLGVALWANGDDSSGS